MWRVVIGLMWVCFALNSHAADRQKQPRYLSNRGFLFDQKILIEPINPIVAKKTCPFGRGNNCEKDTLNHIAFINYFLGVEHFNGTENRPPDYKQAAKLSKLVTQYQIGIDSQLR